MKRFALIAVSYTVKATICCAPASCLCLAAACWNQEINAWIAAAIGCAIVVHGSAVVALACCAAALVEQRDRV